jgi:hypothetical protein
MKENRHLNPRPSILLLIGLISTAAACTKPDRYIDQPDTGVGTGGSRTGNGVGGAEGSITATGGSTGSNGAAGSDASSIDPTDERDSGVSDLGAADLAQPDSQMGDLVSPPPPPCDGIRCGTACYSQARTGGGEALGLWICELRLAATSSLAPTDFCSLAPGGARGTPSESFWEACTDYPSFLLKARPQVCMTRSQFTPLKLIVWRFDGLGRNPIEQPSDQSCP